MIPIRKLVRWVLVVFLALTACRLGAQWALPASYDRNNDKQNPVDMRNGKGLGMDLLYYENFESKENLVTIGWGKVPSGWSQEMVTTNPSNAVTYWTLSNGGGRPRDDAFNQPGRAFDGKQNALCHGKTTQARQRLVTPKLDLKEYENGDPRLVFYYASPEMYNGFCRLELQYREGTSGQWKRIPGTAELTRVEGWTQVSIALPKDVRKDNVYLGFVSIQNNGYGTAIDEVYVVNMVGAQAQVKSFDFRPQSRKVSCGAKKVPLMRINVAIGPGGGRQKLVNLVNEKVAIHTYNPKTNSYLPAQAIENLYLYVGQGTAFSSAKCAGELQTTGGTSAAYKVSKLDIKEHSPLIMQGGNSYSVWIVADLKDGDELPYKTKIWIDANEESFKFIWLDGEMHDDCVTVDAKEKEKRESYFPTKGHKYVTPEEQKSVVNKQLAFDNFDNGPSKWETPASSSSSSSEQLWAIGKPDYNKTVYEGKKKEWPAEQVPAAYSGSKVLATGEILEGEVLRARYFKQMTVDEAGKQGIWIQKKELIDATNVKDVYLMMQRSFNTPYGMIFIVEGRYENDQQWVEFARYSLASSDWTGWQPMALRLARADGQKFYLRLRAYYPSNDVSRTGFIIDDFEVLGDEVQDDVGITSLTVTDSWDNGKGRKVKFKVKNFGKNPQSNVKYDVYIDGNRVVSDATISESIATGSEQEVTTDQSFDDRLMADLKKDNTHHVEVRLKLENDEDVGNNIKSVRVYSYPTIEVTDSKFYPEKYGDPMRHWFGVPYKEGYRSSWIFNTVYSISKCRQGEGLGGKFGTGLLLGNYIWTTGDHSALGYEQSVLESPVFQISTESKEKEFVMAYVTEGSNVLFRVEYRKENDTEWKKLEKSTTWEKGWYGNGGASGTPSSTDDGWRGSVDKYTIVKTQLPDELQGKKGQAVKVQFRVYFYNKEAGRAQGLAINGVEIRPMRADLSIASHTPEGGCGHPLGNDETLKIKIKNSNKPAVEQEAMKLPVSISVTRDGQTLREVKQLNLEKLEPGVEKEYDTEVLLPWGEEFGKDSEISVMLLPQSSEKGLADEDLGNNTYSKKIEAKVPASFPLKELVVEKGEYKLYASKDASLDLLTGPYDKDQYKGYNFSEFSICEGTCAKVDATNKFTVTEFGNIKLKYKVGGTDGCTMELPIEIAEAKCDMTIESIVPVGELNCKDEKDDLSFKVQVKDNVSPSTVKDCKLVVTQGGRELYNQPAKVGSNSVTIQGSNPAKRVRSGGGKLKFTVVAEADKDGSNNMKAYDKDILLYPSPLTVYLQDVQDETFMRIVESSETKGENTYGSRNWQLYVPKTTGIDKVLWKDVNGYVYPGEEEGHKLKLQTYNGVIKAFVGLSFGGQTCPDKEVFTTKINNQDIEVQGLGGVTGLPTLCKDANGNYSLYVGVVNNSSRTYNTETHFGFELSNVDGTETETVKVKLDAELNPRVLRQLPLGDVPAALKPKGGEASVSLKVKYIGFYTDRELTQLELDAYDGNNERQTELKLSEAPRLKWDGIKEEKGEYVVKKVFPVGGTMPTDKLKVDESGVAGMSYAWYSQSGDEKIWHPELNSGTLTSEFQIMGVPEDRYKVEITNLSGCRSELTMRYIQTDVAFDEIEPIKSPSSTCRLSENNGQLVLRLKNTGSKNLTSDMRFIVRGTIAGEQCVSDTMYFDGDYTPHTTFDVPVKGLEEVDLKKALETEENSIQFNDLKLEIVGDWAVTQDGKNIQSQSVEAMGEPDPRVYLLKMEPKDFINLDRHSSKLMEPKEGMKSGEEYSIDKTYAGTMTGYAEKKKEENAVWRWRYNSRYDYTKLETQKDKDNLAELAQELQKEWMKAHINEVGAVPNTLKVPKYPEGDYIVEVTDKNLCQARVRFSVREKAYDIELEDLLLPQSSCDMPKEGTNATAIIRNVGTMTVSKDAKIKLTLKRTDENEPDATTEKRKAYQKFLDGVGKKKIEKELTVGELSGGKDLEKGDRIQLVVPLSLYYEYEVGKGVKASALDGMKFKFEAKVEFVDPETYNETNTTNNEKKGTNAVEDYITPRVTKFSVQTQPSSAPGGVKFLNFEGDGGYYVWKKSGGTESLPVSIAYEPDDAKTHWKLRYQLLTDGNKSEVQDVSNINVKGTGRIDVYLTTKGGCEGKGSFSIMGEKPDLVVKAIVDGLPGELCPEGVAGARKVKVQIENLSPLPLNTSDNTKPCGSGELSQANVKLTLTDGLHTSNTLVKEFKPEEVFGASKQLYSFEWQEDVSTNTGSWKKTKSPVNGVGLSGFGKVEVTLDGFTLNQAKWVAGVSGDITVKLEGGCEDKNSEANNTYTHKVAVRKSPDMANVLIGERKYYVRTGETATWDEQWETTQKLQREMEWGKVGAAVSMVHAQENTPNNLTLPLSASESGQYMLKVRDDLGCEASKKIKVSLPGFLALADGAVKVTPQSLLDGACDYNASKQGLEITVTNSGNEPLELKDKRTSLELNFVKPDGTVEIKRFDHTFKADAAPLEVGLSHVIDFSTDFKNGVTLDADGTYKLTLQLIKGVTNPVDELEDKDALRGAAQKVELKRFYKPKGVIDLKAQLAKIYGKSASELNFKQLPKSPEKFKLYGLAEAPENGAAPSGDEFTKLQQYGAKWTWYLNDTVVLEGPSPSAFEKEFSVPDPYGKVKVALKTNQGCELPSEEVEMYRLREYKFSPVTLGKMSSRGCADKTSKVGTAQKVTGSFTLVKADGGVLKKSGELKLTCKYTVPENGKQVAKELTCPVPLDKDIEQGEKINFVIQVPFKVGDNSVTIAGGTYKDLISGNVTNISGYEGAPEKFSIKSGPYFVSEVKTPQEASEKPYLIQLPEVKPGIEGDNLTYRWDEEDSKSIDKRVSESKDYNLEITESNGCKLQKSIRVDFFFKYELYIKDNLGGSLLVRDTEENSYSRGERKIKDGTKVKLIPQPEENYVVNGVSIDDIPFDYNTTDHVVTKDFKILVLFESKSNSSSGSGNDPSGNDSSGEDSSDDDSSTSAVESTLLRGIVAVNPFDKVLRLHGAENVESYSVYNQLGVEVLRGVNTSPSAGVLEVGTQQLQEGVYVVRLRDANGGERVLRVVKTRGL